MRESAASKARRILGEGRVYVVRVSGDHVDAVVRGDSAEMYAVRHDGGSWSCTCPAGSARTVRCSHVRALQLVTVPAGSWIAGPDLQVLIG